MWLLSYGLRYSTLPIEKKSSCHSTLPTLHYSGRAAFLVSLYPFIRHFRSVEFNNVLLNWGIGTRWPNGVHRYQLPEVVPLGQDGCVQSAAATNTWTDTHVCMYVRILWGLYTTYLRTYLALHTARKWLNWRMEALATNERNEGYDGALLQISRRRHLAILEKYLGRQEKQGLVLVA